MGDLEEATGKRVDIIDLDGHPFPEMVKRKGSRVYGSELFPGGAEPLAYHFREGGREKGSGHGLTDPMSEHQSMDEAGVALLEAELRESYRTVERIYERIRQRLTSFRNSQEGVESMAYQLHNLEDMERFPERLRP